MNQLWETLNALDGFLETGGEVLWTIFALSVILWTLIAERLLFFRRTYPALARECVQAWQQRRDKRSRQAQHIRTALISRIKIRMGRTLPLIKTVIALCPLLGLLGTVTGMIHVFDVMAAIGTGNARAMANGVSRATIPTMAGMVIAIAGLYFARQIEERINEETHHLTDCLRFD